MDVDGLAKGSYYFTLELNDTSNNINTSTTWVYVYDGTPPTVTGYGNHTYEGGDPAVNLTWTAYDRYPAYYEVYRNGLLYGSGSWTSNVNISGLIDNLTLGEFNYSIIVFDESGNNITDTVFITVQDTTLPVITSVPNNVTYFYSETGNNLSWSAMDFYPWYYQLLDNGSPNTTNLWVTDTINVSIDGLTIGIHNLTIVFNHRN